MITIVPLTNDLLPQVAALADQIFPQESVPPSMGITASLVDTLRQELNDTYHESFKWFRYWVAINDQTSEVVGFIGLYEEGETQASETCWLGWFGVAKGYRGKGVGKLLLKHAINQAKLMNKQSLCVYTSNNNHRKPAMNLYSSLGFKPIRAKNHDQKELKYFRLKLTE